MPEPEPSARPSRPWSLVVVGLVAAWALFLAFFGPRAPRGGNLTRPDLTAPSPPRRADYSWVVQDLDGAPVELARYRGRPIFLNVWATWCPPCVAEMPSIANLADNRRLKDVAFLCVSADQSAETVRNFLRGKSWSMTILRATDVPDAFATQGIPATFLIAPDGQIAASHLGSAQWDDPSVVDFLEALAKRPGPVAEGGPGQGTPSR